MGFLFFAWYLSQVGVGVGQVRFFFLLGILSQIRGATADGEKRVVMGMGWGHFGPFGATEVQVPIPH